MDAHEKKAKMRIVMMRPGPTMPTSAMASSSTGNDKTTSTKRHKRAVRPPT
jgi:hypothetical protein